MKFDHRTLTTAMDFQKTKMKHNAQKKKKVELLKTSEQ